MAKNGNRRYSIESESDAQHAVAELEKLAAAILEMEDQVAVRNYLQAQELYAQTESDLKDYALRAGMFEHGGHRFVKVAPERFSWNAERLRALVPKSLFPRLCNMVPDPEKIDRYLRSGKLDQATIQEAYESRPSTPYARHYTPGAGSERAAEEAERVASALEL